MDKEKLLRLVSEVQDCGCDVTDVVKMNYVENAVLVDHLVANGVVVPVHCKDCRHWADGVAGCTDHIKCCKIGFYMVGENGYCVYGERREGNEP